MKKSFSNFLSGFSSFHLLLCVLIISCNTGSSNSKDFDEKVVLGSWTENQIAELLTAADDFESDSEKIEFISSEFLDTKYEGNTLIGKNDLKEVLTINFEGVDCFTLLDYVQSLSLSSNFKNFKENLVKIRYKNGQVDYRSRNHFFSDWAVNNSEFILDVTKDVAPDGYQTITKILNKKNENNDVYLEGIPFKKREINYIPSAKVNQQILGNLKTGDYIGIFTNLDGLDVTHTGIVVRNENEVIFRHASSRSKNDKVVDENLAEYISNKPGIIVFRAH